MGPTEILTAEHRIIEQVLDCLELVSTSWREGRPPGDARVHDVLEVLGTFADRCHHGKEEDLLFPMLVARGMSTRIGPIAVMLDDHTVGREYVRDMRRAVADGDAQRFTTAAERYVALLREHIRKEDGVLFPMAESILDAPARDALSTSFETFERDDFGTNTRARMVALADELAEHFGVAKAAERSPAAVPVQCAHRFDGR